MQYFALRIRAAKNALRQWGLAALLVLPAQPIYQATAKSLLYPVEVDAITEERLVFLEQDGALNDSARAFESIVARAGDIGLNSQDYAPWLSSQATEAQPQELDNLVRDRIMVDRFIRFAMDSKYGKANPERPKKLPASLREGLKSALLEQNIRSFFGELAPQQEGYLKLQAAYKDALKKERRYEASLAQVGIIKPGENDKAVASYKAMLATLGYYSDNPAADGKADLAIKDRETLFDAALVEAVKAFQRENALKDDGAIGPATKRLLLAELEGNLDILRVNLERWRWLPERYGSDYILVNIANFDVNVYADSEPVLSMKAIVGKNYRKTPLFTGQMSYFVVNPSWYIPPTIARKDMLPKLQKDPGFLAKSNMEIFSGSQATGAPLNPYSVDWKAMDGKRFPYLIKQNPGPENALGTVKFMFPNEHNVYLHDTNKRELFNQSQRALSSGCIRVEKPQELIEHLRARYTSVSASAMSQQLASGAERSFSLKQKIPVHLQYWTAWVDKSGRVVYRDDIYGRDQELIDALAI